jgi:tRNA-splicing ligase RtcB
MPDVHRAGEFCVGTVVASDRDLFPNAVGGDIGCGMLALRFEHSRTAQELLADPEKASRLLGQWETACPGRRHHRGRAPDLPDSARAAFSHASLDAQRQGEACCTQLGTLGDGNHFLELQADEEGHLWLMLHTGSRHLGQLIHRHHLLHSQRLPTGIQAIEAGSVEGRAYCADVQVGRAWAKANRHSLAVAAARVVHEVVGAVPRWESLIDCDHNHLASELHGGRWLMVHRKGATAAHEGEPGLIPGSMATRSYHTAGKGCAESLCSSSHGAGRCLSRGEARAHISRQRLREQLTRAGVWYDPRLEATLVEESPTAYKMIEEVMSAQAKLTKSVRRLQPLLIYKAR